MQGAHTNSIIANPVYTEAGPDTGTVCVVTLNEDGTETYEYIDADVEEKRKAEEEAQAGRNVRP